METEKVILSTETYDRLKEIQKKYLEFTKAHTIIIKNKIFENYTIYTDDKALKKLGEDLIDANNKIIELEEKIKILENKKRKLFRF